MPAIYIPTEPRDWLNFDVEFLLFDKNRPKILREIIASDPWRRLCLAWLYGGGQKDIVRRMRSLRARSLQVGWRRAVEQLSDADREAWPSILEAFSEFCLMLRREMLANAQPLSPVNPEWTPRDIDLAFLFAVRSWPENMKDLLAKQGADWKTLFQQWYSRAGGDRGYLQRLFAQYELYNWTGDDPNFGVERAVKIQQAYWDRAIKLFRQSCNALLSSGVAKPGRLLTSNTNTWLPSGINLDFLLKERPPSSINSLMKRSNQEWRSLLKMFHEFSQNPVANFDTVVDGWDGNRQQSEVAIDSNAAQWSTFMTSFGTACIDLAGRLREHRKALIKANPKKSSKEIDREAHFQREARAATNQAVRQRSTGDLKGIVEFEATLLAAGSEVKVGVAEAYRKFKPPEQWPGEKGSAKEAFDRARAVFDGPVSRLSSAEAAVRAATTAVRMKSIPQPDQQPGARVVPALTDLEETALHDSWVDYGHALADLVQAPAKAAEVVVQWAISDTSRKMTDNFAAVSPILNGTLLSVQTVLLGFRVLNIGAGAAGAVAFGIGPAVALAVNSGISLVSDLSASVLKTLAVAEDAKDPENIRRHLGREYGRRDSAGNEEQPGLAATVAQSTPSIIGTASNIASQAVKSTSIKTMIGRTTPLFGEVVTAAGLVVEWREQMDPSELLPPTDKAGRKKVLDAFDAAYKMINQNSGNAAPPKVFIGNERPDGSFNVWIGGTSGVFELIRTRDPETGAVIKVEEIPRFRPLSPIGRQTAVISAFRRQMNGSAEPYVKIGAGHSLVGQDLYLITTDTQQRLAWNDLHNVLAEQDNGTFRLMSYAKTMKQDNVPEKLFLFTGFVHADGALQSTTVEEVNPAQPPPQPPQDQPQAPDQAQGPGGQDYAGQPLVTRRQGYQFDLSDAQPLPPDMTEWEQRVEPILEARGWPTRERFVVTRNENGRTIIRDEDGGNAVELAILEFKEEITGWILRPDGEIAESMWARILKLITPLAPEIKTNLPIPAETELYLVREDDKSFYHFEDRNKDFPIVFRMSVENDLRR
ncbi:hypothetical protein [Amycolatopsis sp. cmx-4-61]|uniref:hypothetical protein n=1 Tax=Amycolatopsis sp. cmx-4-61 TaxID=2790937 RepID=UPI0039791B7C